MKPHLARISQVLALTTALCSLPGFAAAEQESNNTPATANPLTLNASAVSHSTSASSDIDFVRFDANAGQTVTFAAAPQVAHAADRWTMQVYRGSVSSANLLGQKSFGRTSTGTSFPVTNGTSATVSYFVRMAAISTAFSTASFNVRAQSATTPTNQPPSIWFSAPSAGSTLTLGQTLTVNVGASDSDGSISQLEIRAGTQVLNSSPSSNLSVNYTPTATGSVTLFARATDNQQLSGETSLTIDVQASELPSNLSLVSATMTGPEHYSVLLRGTGFAADAYVHVRDAAYGNLLAELTGAQLIRGGNAANSTLEFTITDQNARAVLIGTGLFFYVVNPGNNTPAGPLGLIRQSPEIQSVTSTGSDGYTVRIDGSNFAPNARVDARRPGDFQTSPTIYQGTQVQHGVDWLSFRITDSDQRDLFRNGGLNFWVVNPAPPMQWSDARLGTWVQPPPVAIGLNEARVIDPDSYTVTLLGSSFPVAMAVKVQSPAPESPEIASYSGSQLVRGTAGVMDTVTLRLQGSTERNLLDTSGAHFSIVNLSTNDRSNYILTSKVALARGGSNYLVYRVNYSECAGRTNYDNNTNGRECYGVIQRYHESDNNVSVRSIVQGQFSQMLSNGQRKIRIGLYFSSRPIRSSIVINPDPSGSLGARNLQNLRDLLTDARQLGFNEIEIGLFPLWESSPYCFSQAGNALVYPDCANASGTEADITQLVSRYQTVISEVRAVAEQARVNAGVNYRLDLGNELVAESARPAAHFTALRRIWDWYASSFGSNDTVGFSIPLDSTYAAGVRLGQLGVVFGARPPSALQVHIYGDHGHWNSKGTFQTILPDTEEQIFVAADTFMDSQSALFNNLPWIIGETWYSDSTTAQRLDAAIRNSNRKIQFLLQWPRWRNDAGPCQTVPGTAIEDCAPNPADLYQFGPYIERGF